MADDVIIRIKVIDDAGNVLVDIGKDAEKAGASLKKMGADGKKGMADVEQGAKKADQAMRTFERTSLAVGAAAGALALATIKASSAFQNQQRQIEAINRLYGDASDAVLQYAERIQDSTRYSNDSARQSAVLLNSLVANYGLAQGQIEQLMSRSADLAALHGKSLEEVSQMVTNALRGEGEYIEQIGVSMNQTFVASQAAARGMEDFIGSMTQAEQAAFRFTLLMEQTATASGYAMEQASGTRGAIALLKNEFGDLAQAAGGALGPVGELAAEFSEYALWMPLIASQTARVSAILVNSARSGQIAASAMSLLTFAISPLGIALAGIVAIGTVVGLKFLEQKQSMAQVAAQAEMTAASYKMLEDSIASMYLAGDTSAAEWVEQQNGYFQDWMNNWQDSVAATLQEGEGPDSLFESLIVDFETGGEKARQAFVEAMQITPEEETQINSSLSRLFSLANNDSINADQFMRDTEAFFTQLWADVAAGIVPPENISEEIDKFFIKIAKKATEAIRLIDDFDLQSTLTDLRIDGMDSLADDVLEFERISERMLNVRDTYVKAMRGDPNANFVDLGRLDLTIEQASLVEAALARIQDLMMTGDFDSGAINAALFDLERLFLSGKINAEQYANAVANVALGDQFLLEHINKLKGLEGAWGDVSTAVKTSGEEMKAEMAEQAEAFAEQARAFRDAYQDMVSTFTGDYFAAFGMDDPVSQINLTGLRNEYTALAGTITDTATAMDTVFRVIVGNTNALGSQVQGIYDWAEALINVEGEYGKIDDLLASQAITQTEYAQAQTAFNDIARENAEIQEHILTIQAKQAPFIRDNVTALEDQLDALSGQSAEQQRITLGWMDSGTAAQAYTLITQAAQVATGALGESGEEAFHAMIEGAIAVNPFLFDMLETVGLISGTPMDFDVNFEGVTGAMTEIEMLTIRIEDLVRALGGDLTPIDIEVNGEEDLRTAADLFKQLAKDTAVDLSINFNTDDPAFGLGGRLGAYLRGEPAEPVVIPAVIEVAEGGAKGATGAAKQEPIKVPAVLDLDTSKLTTMGQGAEVVFTVDDTAVQRALGEWVSKGQQTGPTIMFSADASQVAIDLAYYLNLGQLTGPTVMILGDASEVATDLAYYVGLGAVSGPTVTLQSDASAPAEALAYYLNLGSLAGPTIVFSADTSSVDAAMNRYPSGRVISTQYVDIVTRSSGSVAFAHGGLASYAGGGVLAHAAEGNRPEIAKFANGGQALLTREADYLLPPRTLITPSNAVRGVGSMSIVIQAGDFYGASRPDLDRWAAEVLVPAISEEAQRLQTAEGFN